MKTLLASLPEDDQPPPNHIAELKEAFGRLYKRVEEAEAASKEQREKDRQVLSLWAETNLVQTELLKKQTQLIEQLTLALQKNESYWQKFSRSSADLVRDLIDLKGQLMTTLPQAGSAETRQIEAQSGEAVLSTYRMKSKEMLELEATLARIWAESEEMPAFMRLERLNRIARTFKEIQEGREVIYRLSFDQQPVTKKTSILVAASAAAMAAIAVVLCLELFPPRAADLSVIKTHLDAANTRLTRIEKRIGVNPR